MPMPSVDVLVVGLGPAGARAAAAAAARGARVLAVERRPRIGVPVQCAEFVPLPMGRYARETGAWVQAIEHMTTVLPSGATRVSDFPGMIIDRATFDQGLAEQARQRGAELRTQSPLLALDPRAGRARIRRAGETRTVAFGALVAADGPASTVAARLGLPPLPCVHTRQYTVPLNQGRTDTLVRLSPAFPGGYGWLFPRGGQAHLGLGMDKSRARDLKTPLEAWHRQLVNEGLVGARILARTGGAIPVGGLRHPLCHGRVLFAGDAAGLTHPITGGGIAPAVLSGEAAGTAAAARAGGDAAAPQDYAEDLQDTYGPGLARAVDRRRELDRIWGTRRAGEDTPHRRGWIAFDEYFAATA
ncbi:geranylgeranyl reductase [Ectothiorhodospira mobilis]|nr:NAD(P)/FAD-dependent oxidoreductase [Ectothiorhodospira mobilis]MBK1692900.1 geranylgeranyl reductase [Ectothiorhodospira mobilis]